MTKYHFAVDCRYPGQRVGIVIWCAEREIDLFKPPSAVGYVGCSTMTEAKVRAELMEKGEHRAYGPNHHLPPF
jgi:hypothetical protein